jgi:hypothetical protein
LPPKINGVLALRGVERDLVEGVGDVGAEEKKVPRGKRASVTDDVQGTRKEDALALVNQRVDVGAEQVPDDAVLHGAIGLGLADEGELVDRKVRGAELRRQGRPRGVLDGPALLDHGGQQGVCNDWVVFAGAVV